MVNLLLIIIYLAFISLGLPDSLLGAAWPSMYVQFDVPVSYMGMVSMIVSAGTIISSLNSDRLTRRFSAGLVTAVSVAMTAVAILGFSFSTSFWMTCLWAIPYGLGAGSIDAALNNYVALHYASRHMSWLHCMWGVGTIIGPYAIGFGLTNGFGWEGGYRSVFAIQVVLTIILFVSLPLWKKTATDNLPEKEASNSDSVLALKQILQIPGAKQIMLTFFCYCALEATTAHWASSYMVLQKGIPAETAANYASLFFIGITVGRAINGFLTMKFTDSQMIRAGQAVIAVGIVVMLLPFGNIVTLAGLILIGLGCAPIYPCIIHSTPEHFGADKSQALIGVQMASAYVGSCLMPPLFGLIANFISASLFPIYLIVFLVIMILAHNSLLKK
ncbi:MAG: MFS transporter [Lachnospiraceae bacterium]|nr:MFS transporter [Lachnospiraceae bacterium]